MLAFIEDTKEMKNDDIKKLMVGRGEEWTYASCIEELAELIQALTKYKKIDSSGENVTSDVMEDLKSKLRCDVLEEVIDVLVILEMIVKRFDFSAAELKKEYQIKMKRNLERI